MTIQIDGKMTVRDLVGRYPVGGRLQATITASSQVPHLSPFPGTQP